MEQNEKKEENSVARPFGIQMLEAQKAPRLKTGVNAGTELFSRDINAVPGRHRINT